MKLPEVPVQRDGECARFCGSQLPDYRLQESIIAFMVTLVRAVVLGLDSL